MKSSKSRKTFLAIAAIALIAVLTICIAGCVYDDGLDQIDSTDGRVTSSESDASGSGNNVFNNYTVQTNIGTPSSTATDYTALIGDIIDSVVLIYTKTSASDSYSSTGSGVFYGEIVDENASLIVTCTHVVEDAASIMVVANSADTDTTNDIKLSAEIIGMDDISDVAVLKVEGTGYDYATLRNTDEAPILLGEEATAIGNALGAGISVTKGIISGTSRTISMDGISMTLLQIDAAVNGGNSGGALFDAEGYLIGIVNAKSTGTDVEGIGYAIPVYDVISKSQSLIETSGNPDYNGLGYIDGTKRLGITVSQMNSEQVSANFRNITSVPADGGYYYYCSSSYEISPYGSVARSGASDAVRGALITGVTVNGVTKTFTDEYLLDDMLSQANINDTVTLNLITIGTTGGIFAQSYVYTATSVNITLYQYVCGFTG